MKFGFILIGLYPGKIKNILICAYVGQSLKSWNIFISYTISQKYLFILFLKISQVFSFSQRNEEYTSNKMCERLWNHMIWNLFLDFVSFGRNLLLHHSYSGMFHVPCLFFWIISEKSNGILSILLGANPPPYIMVFYHYVMRATFIYL